MKLGASVLGALVVTGLLAAACGSGGGKVSSATTTSSASATPEPTSTVSTPDTTEPTSSATTPVSTFATTESTSTAELPAQGSGLTGFGATDGAWNASHTEASGFDPGSTYGAIVPIPGDSRQHQWAGVDHSAGRIIGFTYSMPAETTEAAAKHDLAAQLPPDATTTSFTVQHDSAGNVCAFWNLRSSTIAQVLGGAPFGDSAGDIGIELFTVSADASSYTYDPRDVNTTSVNLVPADDTTNC
jgi:hypothetical protein